MEISDVLLGLISLIMTCSVPWAYKIHGRLTAIEVGLKDTREVRVTLEVLKSEMHRMDMRIVKVESEN